MREVDAKGLICPKPLILTKKMLNEVSVNEQFIVLIDNETSKTNVRRFLKDNKAKVEFTREDNTYRLLVTKLEENISHSEAENFSELHRTKKGNHIYILKTRSVANDELGEMLTNGFLDTIKEVEPLPDKLIFYHEGVFLTLDDSPVLDKLKVLESLGVEILICGNCVNYYDVVDRVSVGKVSNAYDILQAMTNAGHLIYP